MGSDMNGQLIDGSGRIIEYLRVSVTDRCNLRCTYCMPPSGVEVKPRCDILRYKDLLRLIEIFAGIGIRKVRLTGGEPLVRKGIIGFIDQINHIPGIEQITLTTNGVALGKMATPLINAGVTKVNISLDSLDRAKYKHITGADELLRARNGIQAAIDAGFKSVKINMVVMKGVNDDEVGKFVELTKSMKIQVRFLEFMPATPSVWSDEKFIPITEVKKRVGEIEKLVPCAKEQWSGPAKVYKFNEALGEIGFIAAVTSHFCGDCNRLRLTSSGELVNCLFNRDREDLKSMLIAGASNAEIEDTIRLSVKGKNAIRVLPTHAENELSQNMSAIGG